MRPENEVHQGLGLPPGETDGHDSAEPAPVSDANRDRFHSPSDIHILVLDDDPLICRLIQSSLAQHHFTIDAVPDAALMSDRLKVGTYHLFILDYMIPGVNFEEML